MQQVTWSADTLKEAGDRGLRDTRGEKDRARGVDIPPRREGYLVGVEGYGVMAAALVEVRTGG